MLRALVLTIAAAGAIGLAVSATPANARVAAPAAPSVESNKLEVRCHHHRRSSRWHCPRPHPNYYYRPYYQPFYAPPHRWHRWHHHRHRHHWHRHW